MREDLAVRNRNLLEADQAQKVKEGEKFLHPHLTHQWRGSSRCRELGEQSPRLIECAESLIPERHDDQLFRLLALREDCEGGCIGLCQLLLGQARYKCKPGGSCCIFQLICARPIHLAAGDFRIVVSFVTLA